MSVSEKINDYLLRKVSRSKVNSLFMISKEYLFTLVHDLNEKVEQLEEDKLKLSQTVHRIELENNTIIEVDNDIHKELEAFQKENLELKKQLNTGEDAKYKLAYERLAEKFIELQGENRDIKKSVEVIGGVLENTEKQNKQLKEQYRILTTQNERLTLENKAYKEKENKVVEIKKANTVGIRKGFTIGQKSDNKVLSR